MVHLQRGTRLQVVSLLAEGRRREVPLLVEELLQVVSPPEAMRRAGAACWQPVEVCWVQTAQPLAAVQRDRQAEGSRNHPDAVAASRHARHRVRRAHAAVHRHQSVAAVGPVVQRVALAARLSVPQEVAAVEVAEQLLARPQEAAVAVVLLAQL